MGTPAHFPPPLKPAMRLLTGRGANERFAFFDYGCIHLHRNKYVMSEIWPQRGFQEKFLKSQADIVVGGGAVGAGKSFAMLLEATRHKKNPNFGAVIFRRTMPQVKNEGGLWDTSVAIYSALRKAWRPKPLEHSAAWVFPSGARVKFSHMQYEKDMYTWQGSQVPLIGFDELTHFLPTQFWYMLTRNRSTCGVKPYVRCTTNPQSRGWVKNLVQWWLYPDDHPDESLRGYPIPERDGVLRYVTRYKNRLIFGDTARAVIDQLPETIRGEYDENSIKSLTFIAGTLEGNPALTSIDPTYKANLLAQDEDTAMQLLKGRWYATGNEDELCKYEALECLFTNDHVPFGADKYITADIAMEGSDMFVIVVWEGWRAVKTYTVDKSDGKQVLNKMLEIKTRHGVPGTNIAFDSSGVGNFLKGWLKYAIDFRGGDPPVPDDKVKLKYKNLKTQCAFVFAEKVNGYAVQIDVEGEALQERIVEEFDKHRKTGLDQSDRICMTHKDEVKAETGRSPDYFDGYTMRSIFDLRKKKRKRSTH